MTGTEAPHVSALTAMLYPAATKRCDHCGGYVASSVDEALRRYAESLYEPLQSLTKALSDPAVTAAYGLGTYGAPMTGKPGGYDPSGWMAHQHHGHGRGRWHEDDCGCGSCGKHDCGCRSCEKDDCHCRCCIVPIVIENNRRREREVTLELSSFTSKGGRDTNVVGEIAGPAEFTLAACEEREVVIGIGFGEGRDNEQSGRDRLPDVDDCEVAYADLRVAGCDIRPIRIAVAVLPRDCHAYRADCGCGCC
jgi:hypothetical protein